MLLKKFSGNNGTIINMSPTWEEYIVEVSGLLEGRETYQRKLGKIAFEITEEYGSNALKAFSEDLKETGLKASFATLKNYRWVHGRLRQLDIPQDIPYYVLQHIAGSENPQHWADLIDKGWSGAEILRAIKEEKGVSPKPMIVNCPKCNHEFDAKSKK